MLNYINDFHKLIEKHPDDFGVDIHKLKRLTEKMVKDKKIIQKPHKVERVIDFCREFHHREGRQFAGKPLELDVAQKYFVACVFGFYTFDKETKAEIRYYTEAVLFVARKWGKSLFVSALADYMLLADGEPAAQIWNLATKKQQAAIVYGKAKQMLESSSFTPEDDPKRYWRTKRDTDNDEIIVVPSTGSYMKAGSKNSESQDGLNPHCYTIDELQAITVRNTYDVFSSATGARSQPLGLIISSFGFVREGIFDSIFERCQKVLDGQSKERLFPMIFRIDDNDDYRNPKCWKKANPALGERPTMRYLKAEYQKTLNDPAMLPSFLAKNLNRASNQSIIYYDKIQTDKCASNLHIEEVVDTYAVVGVDLAETTDLCCATIMVPLNGRLKIFQKYFIASARLIKNSKRDKQSYESFTKTGSECPVNDELLHICEGSKVRKSDVTKWIVDMEDQYKLTYLKIGYDRWHADDWLDGMVEEGGYSIEDKDGNGVLSEVIQGAKTLSEPMKETRVLFEDKIIEYNRHNGLFRWCVSNTAIRADINNNIQPNKAKAAGRIDGLVSFLIAYVAFLRCAQDFVDYQGWEE
jgi:phage terminase large subunit-like protein